MAIVDTALAGRVALVTGGSRGIGRAICVALGQRGATVAVNYTSRQDAADETVKLVEAAGGKAVAVGFDVADSDAVAAEVKRLGKELGGLDILVNNAGVAVNGLIMRFKDADWHKVLDINLRGAFAVSRAAAPLLLRAKDKGRIINLSSVVGESGNAGQAAYAASKAGLIGLTKSLAKELAGRGVCVNAVTPGYIETDMTAAELPEAQRDKLMTQIPLGRIGTPEDVAGAVAFLAGPEASYITGEVLRVNGGMLM
ncbi:3-oxoacyl-[acyl-carrier-protein] reductase [Haliangium sp.]|uniref:3-oxoacyl-[acyl-carrier-protein] reductase n=1 Tax=Haliangium sp. TaxID=2663208 RepID=UPI003D0B6592